MWELGQKCASNCSDAVAHPRAVTQSPISTRRIKINWARISISKVGRQLKVLNPGLSPQHRGWPYSPQPLAIVRTPTLHLWLVPTNSLIAILRICWRGEFLRGACPCLTTTLPIYQGFGPASGVQLALPKG